MTKALDAAIEKIRKLPPERQDDATEVLETFAAISSGEYRLTPEQEAALGDGLREADEGRLASEGEMQRLYRKFGL